MVGAKIPSFTLGIWKFLFFTRLQTLFFVRSKSVYFVNDYHRSDINNVHYFDDMLFLFLSLLSFKTWN